MDEIPSSDLRVYVVWLPVLSRMSPQAMTGAIGSGAKRIRDDRVTHYLDAEGRLGARYGRTIHLPGNEPAWDVYFAYGRTVRWEQEPPAPTYWMHQLGGAPSERRLDGKKLAAVVAGLLAPAAQAQREQSPQPYCWPVLGIRPRHRARPPSPQAPAWGKASRAAQPPQIFGRIGWPQAASAFYNDASAGE